MRRKLVAGNWKMNGRRADLAQLRAIAEAAAGRDGVDVALAVPHTLIAAAAETAPRLAIGGQDCHETTQGAHTGCVSAAMLVDAGAEWVIVGHSERRTDQREDDALVAAKAGAAHREGLRVVLCVGETLAEREAGRAETVVCAQVGASLPDDAAPDWLAIAYEPIWAIGTGRTATAVDASAMHGAIRARLAEQLGAKPAEAMRILYGGSVNAGNAAELLHAPDIDGALVGGASLTAAAFVPIIAAAAQEG